jgi:coenzyme F420-0:L-glutamate ligase/coenzyme F420-1:gamma-L-glutamate ligase
VNPLQLIPVENFPMVKPGDNLAAILVGCLEAQRITLHNKDILVLAQKIVSKSEGRLINLEKVVPSKLAIELSQKVNKDPRQVQVILDESKEVLWSTPGIFVVETHHGYVCANAGVDRSNIEQAESGEWLSLLPQNPDRSAAHLRQELFKLTGQDVAVIINDTHGRPFRMGGIGVALGSAGITALLDRRGEQDLFGYILQNTLVATADELAAAASLLMGQGDEAVPVVLVRGYRFQAASEPDSGASTLIRPPDKDVFRYPARK